MVIEGRAIAYIEQANQEMPFLWKNERPSLGTLADQLTENKILAANWTGACESASYADSIKRTLVQRRPQFCSHELPRTGENPREIDLLMLLS